MYILVSLRGRLQMMRGHIRGRGNGIAIGITNMGPMVARNLPHSDRTRGRLQFEYVHESTLYTVLRLQFGGFYTDHLLSTN